MEIIPAIDLINGECVRLYKGDYEKMVKYYDNPVEVAKKWTDYGARWIHVIDLDGAKKSYPVNLNVVKKIKQKFNILIEYGGGIRNVNSLTEAINAGVDKAIIGTKAIEDLNSLKEFYAIGNGKIIISIDFGKDNVVFKEGWLSGSSLNLFDFGKKIKNSGVKEVIITDISRDGTLEGINIGVVKEFLIKTKLKIFVAGGISNINDIKKIKEIEQYGIKGVIIGKALYEEKINLKEAIKLAEGNL